MRKEIKNGKYINEKRVILKRVMLKSLKIISSMRYENNEKFYVIN